MPVIADIRGNLPITERDLFRHARWLLKKKEGFVAEPSPNELGTVIERLNKPVEVKASGVCSTCGNRIVITNEVITIKSNSGVVMVQAEGVFFMRCPKCGQIVFWFQKK